MLPEFDAVTMLGVLEFDGLIRVEPGAVHTTSRFQRSLAAASRAKRTPHPDLRATISKAMHAMYGKYLSESELSSLVDALLPIAKSEEPRR